MDFPYTHMVQAAMKARVSRTIDGHQKHCRRRCRVRWRPGWQARRDACPHCRTSDHTDSGMNSVFGGAPPGSRAEFSASHIFS